MIRNRWLLVALILAGLLVVETAVLVRGPEQFRTTLENSVRALLPVSDATAAEAMAGPRLWQAIWIGLPVDNSESTSAYDYQYDELEKVLMTRIRAADEERRKRLAYETLEGEKLQEASKLIRETFVKEAGLEPHVRTLENLIREPVEFVGNYTLERVLFTAADGLSVEGLLAIPTSCKVKCPVLIAPNGWSSSPEAVMGMSPPDYQNAFGEKFAQDGYVVFAVFLPTAPGDATRTAAAEAHASFLANMVGEHYWNRMRVEKILSALDFVETLPQADAERIAVYGVSMGGEAGLAAAVLDSRIDALVISGANVLTPRLQMLLELRRFIYPQMYEWNTVALPDVDEMLVGVYPRPVCAEWGMHDHTGDTEAALAVSEPVAEVYTRTGAADRFEIVVHDLATTPDGHETEVTACKEFLDRQFQRAADTE